MPRGKVTRVPDGDTIKIKTGPWFRLEGVNAPEKWQRGFSDAKEALKDMIMGKMLFMRRLLLMYMVGRLPRLR